MKTVKCWLHCLITFMKIGLTKFLLPKVFLHFLVGFDYQVIDLIIWYLFISCAGKKKEDIEKFVNEGVYEVGRLKENCWITDIKYDDEVNYLCSSTGNTDLGILLCFWPLGLLNLQSIFNSTDFLSLSWESKSKLGWTVGINSIGEYFGYSWLMLIKYVVFWFIFFNLQHMKRILRIQVTDAQQIVDARIKIHNLFLVNIYPTLLYFLLENTCYD